jgi:spermidine synthase
MILKRGQYSSYLTNDFVDKAEILRNVTLLHREKSEFQEIRVYDTLKMGRILVLDNAIQFATSNFAIDNYTWDMTQGVISQDKPCEKVLIIGGGDLIIASYILNKYPQV